MSARLTTAVLVLAAVLLAPTPAHAAFPGASGTVAFTSDCDGDTEIYAMRADGSGQAQLTDNLAQEGAAAFSPDGRRIVFTRAAPARR